MYKILIGIIFILCSTTILAQTKPSKKDECKTCKGTSKVKCVICKGEGVLLYTCIECNGEGEINCEKCQKGKVDCYACQGKGKQDSGLKCKICNADGKIKCIYCTNGKFKCFLCHGEKKLPFKCKTCNGNKLVVCLDCFKPDNEEYKCVVCQNKIKLNCPDCGGKSKTKNFIFCETCFGRGVLACDNCQGRGSLLCNSCIGTGRTPKYDSKGNVNVKNSPSCKECEGSGKDRCKKCKGRGSQVCNKCNGERFVEGICLTCNGQGTYDCIWHNKNLFYTLQIDELRMKFDVIPLEAIDPTTANIFYSLVKDNTLSAFVFIISNNRDSQTSIYDQIIISREMQDGGAGGIVNEYINGKLHKRDVKFIKSIIDCSFPIKVLAKSSNTVILVFKSVKPDGNFIINEGAHSHSLKGKSELITPKILKEFQAILIEKRK